jgi:tungstate transport system permease protein
MADLKDGIGQAFALIARLDPDLAEILIRSLAVSLSAVAIAALVGLPLGAALAVSRFPGRRTLVVLLNTLMSLPPVVVGLVVYLLLSRSGPFGVLGLLFTPAAMIAAQTVLVLPIVASLSRQTVADLWAEDRDLFVSLGARPGQAVATLLWDGRRQLATGVLAGFGRAVGEVGAVMIVGGNIDHATRVLTTAIALETSKGNLAFAIGLGVLLVFLSLLVNAGVYALARPDRAESP